MYKIRYKDEINTIIPDTEDKYYMEYTTNYKANIYEFMENIINYSKGHITYEEFEESFHILNKDRVEQLKTMLGLLYKEINEELNRKMAHNINAMMVSELGALISMNDIYEEKFRDTEKKDTFMDKTYIKCLMKYLDNYIKVDNYICSYYNDIVSHKEMMDNIRNLYKERKSLLSKLEDENDKIICLDEKDMISTYLKAIDIMETEINFRLEKTYIKELVKSNSEKGLKTYIFHG